MKIIFWSAGIVLGLLIAVLVLVQIASERVEVVELHTLDHQGEPMTTRLWIVDDGELQYLRSGNGDSLWFQRIQENPSFEVTRNGVTEAYTAQLRPDKRDQINAMMRDKYTWGDSLISVITGSSEAAVPVELHRL